jgi:hypothetical protein
MRKHKSQIFKSFKAVSRRVPGAPPTARDKHKIIPFPWSKGEKFARDVF